MQNLESNFHRKLSVHSVKIKVIYWNHFNSSMCIQTYRLVWQIFMKFNLISFQCFFKWPCRIQVNEPPKDEFTLSNHEECSQFFEHSGVWWEVLIFPCVLLSWSILSSCHLFFLSPPFPPQLIIYVCSAGERLLPGSGQNKNGRFAAHRKD